MRAAKLLTVTAALVFAVFGCRKSKGPAEPNKGPGTTTGKDATVKREANEQTPDATVKIEPGKEAGMGITIQWLGHASFRITEGKEVIYIDPWKLKESAHDATEVLVSHSHSDHYSPDDIEKVSGADTKLISTVDVIAKERRGEALLPGLRIVLDGVSVTGVAAYNPSKEFHPRLKNWVGFVVEVGSNRIYYAGDSDFTDDMKGLEDIDIALLPVGGKYTMTGEEAAEAARQIGPKYAIPYHWGDIVGGRSDADAFAKGAGCEVKVLSPGESAEL
ncbi:MAG: MBL fold metallo-hydrolase [Phycisphaerales bacterium]|nr:MAG: MBL fold metallo-hydrolase [Phycisphaerales bacterium]